MESFYATVTSFEFVLMGLWWNVVQTRSRWLRSPQQRRLVRAVYQSFLVPGTMSLAAQLGQNSRLLWQSVFLVAALFGAVSTAFLLRRTAVSQQGWFRKNHWLVTVGYVLIATIALRPDWVAPLGLQPLQIEGVLVSLLVFFGVSFAWELITEPVDAHTEA